MNITITVTTGSGADVEISQDRPEIRSMSSGDFDARLIAEVLDSVVERVRRSYGITPTSHDPAAVVAGDDNERLDG